MDPDTRSPISRLSRLQLRAIGEDWQKSFVVTTMLPVVALALMYWLVASPIIGSPYWGDDHGDSQLPMQLAFNHESFYHHWINLTREWSATTGRFFPLNIAQAGAVFYFFDTRESYKLYQFCVLALTVTLFAGLVGTMLRSRWAGYAAFGFALMTLQFKSWYDPFWEFGGQQEHWTSYFCLALLFAIVASRTRSRKWTSVALFAGLLALAAAALTYESSLFMMICVPILLWRERASFARKALVTCAYGAVAGALFINLLIQRSHAVVTHPGYQISLDPHLVLRTLHNQMFNAIPLSYRYFTVHALLPDGAGWPANILATIGISALFVVVMAVSITKLLGTHRTGLKWCAIAGLVVWIIPSLFVAISARWQLEVRPGVGYIPVLSGGLAVALLVTVGILTIGRSLRSANSIIPPSAPGSRLFVSLAFVSAVAAAIVIGLTASSNVEAVRDPAIVIYQVRRDAYVSAVQNGLYSNIPVDSIIARPAGEWWNWENAVLSSWYGAPRTLTFIIPEEIAAKACGIDATCFALVEENPQPGLITYRLQQITAG
jgi:hypothetical protein